MHRHLHIPMLVLLTLAHAGRAEWKPADGPLMTRWAKEVSPDNVWPEYPRPQMVRKDWVNLNGLWDYAIVDKDAAQPREWDGKILVPFCVQSALSGVKKSVSPEQALWYRRTFKTPDLDGGKRLLLHFGAVDWHATVYLNGEKIGEHKGGYDPFSFDVTDHLRKDANDLVVRVWDPTEKGFQPRGKQVLKPQGIWYTAVTGIWQTVWLETVPANYIEALSIVPDIDNATVTVNPHVKIHRAESKWNLKIEVLDDGKVVASGGAAPNGPAVIKMENPKLWSPDQPHLYRLRLTCGDDVVQSYFGMRKTEVKKDEKGVNRLFLNGKPLFQFGPLDQGWWPDGLYTPPCDAALKYDIEVAKKLGMNMCRKHVKVEHARFYYWADKMGLLVWQDIPSTSNAPKWVRDIDAIGPQLEVDPPVAENFKAETTQIVRDFGNHPCIVSWVPFNESWGQHDTEGVVALIHQLDPTRPINAASGGNFRGVGQILSVHSYPGPAFPRTDEKMAVVLGEFGGLGWPVEGHLWWNKRNWGYRTYESRQELNTNYLNLLKKLQPMVAEGLSAAIYTQTSDVEGEVNGLMTYDRDLIKIDLEPAAEAARKLYQE